MALSISSSERSIFVFALAALLFLGLAVINNTLQDPQFELHQKDDRFWMHKVFGHTAGSQTIVMSGDSRLYRGLSPAIFESTLPGSKALNYGFSSGGHNPVIFADIDRLLSKDPEKTRAVILAITPYSLTPKAQDNGHYMSYKRRQNESAEPSTFDDYFRAFEQKRLRRILTGTMKIRQSDEISEYYDNGWLRTDWVKRDPGYALDSYQEIFTDNTVSPKVIADIANQTQAWRRQGIIVLAYRPPTTPDMVALENSKSKFDETAFSRIFRDAGGIWVDLDQDYESYDGSHLTPESAEKLSKILAASIAQRAQKP